VGHVYGGAEKKKNGYIGARQSWATLSWAPATSDRPRPGLQRLKHNHHATTPPHNLHHTTSTPIFSPFGL
jgi:hypothetical protein